MWEVIHSLVKRKLGLCSLIKAQFRKHQKEIFMSKMMNIVKGFMSSFLLFNKHVYVFLTYYWVLYLGRYLASQTHNLSEDIML